jgi:hypothetical protein
VPIPNETAAPEARASDAARMTVVRVELRRGADRFMPGR